MKRTKEELMEAVRQHHQLVEQAGYHVVMTSLVGSQNYELDDEYSDVDTYSLVFPSFEDLAYAEKPLANILPTEDGNCYVKDMRSALYLLYHTSPNSVEYFVSDYKVYNPLYQDIFDEYLVDNCYNSKLWYMLHSNYEHMFEAMAGMAKQLTLRNMPAGKRYSHALRLQDMSERFLNDITSRNLLKFLTSRRAEKARKAKRDSENEQFYNSECLAIAEELKQLKSKYSNDLTEDIQVNGLMLIKEFQTKLFARYLKHLMENKNEL